MSDAAQPEFLSRPDGETIAYHATPGKSPGVMFCGGFMSDMTGIKATALEANCRARGRAYVRFDYLGHGRSSGAFVDGTIGRWADDALAVLDRVTVGPQILVGSSMGGWIMLLAALARPERVAGLVGIAAAPDFVEPMWRSFPEEIRHRLRTEGVYHRPSAYADQPYAITMKLIEDGRRHTVLDRAPVPIRCPVRLLHGMRDPDVPWRRSLDVAEALAGDDVTVTFVKAGDHRLSEPADIARLTGMVEQLAEQVAVPGTP